MSYIGTNSLCLYRMTRAAPSSRRPTPRTTCRRSHHAPLTISRGSPTMATYTSTGPRAMVVFVDRAECPWLRVLERGYRHCFVALWAGSGWIICDSLKHHMELGFLKQVRGFNLAGWYASQGHRVLLGRIATPTFRQSTPVSLLTCVSVAKRILATPAPFVLTPSQLFRHLRGRGWHLVSSGRHGIPTRPKFRVDLQSE